MYTYTQDHCRLSCHDLARHKTHVSCQTQCVCLAMDRHGKTHVSCKASVVARRMPCKKHVFCRGLAVQDTQTSTQTHKQKHTNKNTHAHTSTPNKYAHTHTQAHRERHGPAVCCAVSLLLHRQCNAEGRHAAGHGKTYVYTYGMATISRLLKITRLFRRI